MRAAQLQNLRFTILNSPAPVSTQYLTYNPPVVPMPVTAVDEDDRLVLRKHDVGSAGEFFVQRSIHGEAEATTVEE